MLSIQHMPSVSAVSASQVAGWERELELLQTNHFVIRCYLAALKGQDEPSCKVRKQFVSLKVYYLNDMVKITYFTNFYADVEVLLLN